MARSYLSCRVVSRYAGVPADQVAAAERIPVGEVRRLRREADRGPELGHGLVERAPADADDRDFAAMMSSNRGLRA